MSKKPDGAARASRDLPLTERSRAANRASLSLTGDASDRKYFRVLTRGGKSIVLALHADAFDADASPVPARRGAVPSMPLPVPAILDRAPDLGILALEDLGDVTLQAHLGSAPTAEHRRSTGKPSRSSRCSSAAARSSPSPTCRLSHCVRCREADVGARLLHEALSRGLSRRGDRRTAPGRPWQPSGARLAEELAAEPRVLCHRDYHSRNLMLHDEPASTSSTFRMRGWVRIPMISSHCCATRMSICTEPVVEELVAYFIALKRPPARQPARGSVGRRFQTALRRDGVATQPEGARHVRISNQHPRRIPSTFSTSRARCIMCSATSRSTIGSAACESAGGVHPGAAVATTQVRAPPRSVGELPWPTPRLVNCSVVAMTFGISTHLYHGARLDRDHLVRSLPTASRRSKSSRLAPTSTTTTTGPSRRSPTT